jgi:hypothetical protein
MLLSSLSTNFAYVRWPVPGGPYLIIDWVSLLMDSRLYGFEWEQMGSTVRTLLHMFQNLATYICNFESSVGGHEMLLIGCQISKPVPSIIGQAQV